MKKILIIVAIIPLIATAQVNIWVDQIPDTLKQNEKYTLELHIGTSSNFSSLMISLKKSQNIKFTEIESPNAHIYEYKDVINLVWSGYNKQKPQAVDLHFKLNNQSLPNEIKLQFLASYLINGLKGEQLAVYKYILRRKNDRLLYVLENQ